MKRAGDIYAVRVLEPTPEAVERARFGTFVATILSFVLFLVPEKVGPSVDVQIVDTVSGRVHAEFRCTAEHVEPMRERIESDLAELDDAAFAERWFADPEPETQVSSES